MNAVSHRRWGNVFGGCLLVIIGLVSSDTLGADWYDTDWGYRQAVTISNSMVDGTVSNFPVLIVQTNVSDVFSLARSDGRDIVFTTSNGTTKLAHELELYDAASSQLWAWVNAPLLADSQNTVLYMYFGSPGALEQENAGAVWDSHYLMVHHYQETSGTCEDSTTNNVDGTPASPPNEPDQDIVGQVNGANGFDGTNDFISYDDAKLQQVYEESSTLELWIRRRVSQNWQTVWTVNHSRKGFFMFLHPQQIYYYTYIFPEEEFEALYSPNLSFGEWYHVAVTREHSTGTSTMYLNGVVKDTFTRVGTVGDNWTDYVRMGADFADSNPLGGDLDEVRVSTTCRSQSWVITSYRNQSNPAAFLSFGGTTARPGPVFDKTPWYDGCWQFRQEITLSASMVDGTVSNFPALIVQTDVSNVFSRARSDGRDILFTSSNGATKLPHELELYDAAASQLWAWVNAPLLAESQSTKIYMYYGCADASDQQDVANVWDSHYRMVHHYQETSGTSEDSTTNNVDGTPASPPNDPDQDIVGQVNGANGFDGTNDFISYDDAKLRQVYEQSSTLELWIRRRFDQNWQTVWTINHSQKGFFMYVHPRQLYYYTTIYPQEDFESLYSGDLNADEWYHVAITREHSTGTSTMYLNGVVKDTFTNVGTLGINWTDYVWIGGEASGNNPLGGDLDEVRVSTTCRSQSWVITSYRNQSSPSSYIGFGLEQPKPLVGSIIMIR